MRSQRRRFQNGEIPNGEIEKGEKDTDHVEATVGIARCNYSPLTSGGKRWGRAHCLNEYDYGRYWGVGNAWAYLDGLRREVRDPTDEVEQNIDGARLRSYASESSRNSPMWKCRGKPKYAEFPTYEGKKEHMDMEQFAEWVAQSEVGIIADTARWGTGRKKDAEKMPTVGVEFGFLKIPGGSQEAHNFGECYQWVICA